MYFFRCSHCYSGVFGLLNVFCVIRLPRLATRCRGGSRRRGRSGRIWDLVFDRLAYKKPHHPFRMLSHVSHACFRLLLRASPSAHSSFLFYGSLICREWAGHRRSIPRKIMPLVLSVFGFQSQKQYHPWAVTPASEPPGLPGQASELYYEKIR